jgi:hypothetical protein
MGRVGRTVGASATGEDVLADFLGRIDLGRSGAAVPQVVSLHGAFGKGTLSDAQTNEPYRKLIFVFPSPLLPLPHHVAHQTNNPFSSLMLKNQGFKDSPPTA